MALVVLVTAVGVAVAMAVVCLGVELVVQCHECMRSNGSESCENDQSMNKTI